MLSLLLLLPLEFWDKKTCFTKCCCWCRIKKSIRFIKHYLYILKKSLGGQCRILEDSLRPCFSFQERCCILQDVRNSFVPLSSISRDQALCTLMAPSYSTRVRPSQLNSIQKRCQLPKRSDNIPRTPFKRAPTTHHWLTDGGGTIWNIQGGGGRERKWQTKRKVPSFRF